jgi:hypothetical protein
MSVEGVGAEFEKGDQILYTSNSGEIELGVILNIHYDDSPPYYTIRLLRNNHEKVTDEKNLTLLSHEDQEDECEGDGGCEDHRDEANIDSISSDVSQRSSSQWITWIATSGLLFSLGILFSFKVYKNFLKRS